MAIAIWYGPRWRAAALFPLAALVWWVARRRRKRFLASPPSPHTVPVVVVGGITVGGTGKSPVLIALAHALMGEGYRVAVVSRGYGSQRGCNSDAAPHRVQPEKDAATLVGDEPLLIARQLQVPVVVCRQRTRAVAWIVTECDVDVVLSDDGLQHYEMARDYEIAVLDAQRRLGNGWLLPAGPLREPRSRLESVDWLLERNGSDPDTAFHYHIDGVRPAHSDQRDTLEAKRSCWRHLSVIAVTGLGQPDQFFNMLERAGLLLQCVALADHATISDTLLEHHAADVVLITGKDEVKLPVDADPRIWVVDISAELPPGLVDSVRAHLQHRSA